MKRPIVFDSFTYLLLSQIPFVATVFIIYFQRGFDVADVMTQPWIRHLAGSITTVIYGFLAATDKQVERIRLVIFMVLAIAANSALILISGQLNL